MGSRASAGDWDRRARSYTLILGGGGARGFAHAGVLRALERLGSRPSAIVGVSMGAIIGAAYSLRRDWYAALLDFAEIGLPTREGHAPSFREGPRSKIKGVAARAKAMWDLNRGWGASSEEVAVGRDALRQLLGEADLAEGRVPIAVSATDLLSGERVVIRSGPAFDAVYASSALAGVLPPESRGSFLLADGAYTDVCPIDVALEYGNDCLVAVHPGRADVVHEIRSGLEAIVRATEICYTHHAALRFDSADVVIRPPFRRQIDTLEFSACRECIAAGIRGVRANTCELARVLVGA
ncbi:MAG: patatin-like phospholipase family protein [Gemmatimonadota bacterium]|nr:patatin-like phospholipase family protein [Gemmatimonadota bacterium]